MKRISQKLTTQNSTTQWKTGLFILFLVFQTVNVLAKGNTRDVDSNDTIVFENQYQYDKYIIENKQFVLRANFLRANGYRRFVNSAINFVKIDSTNAVIQIGSDYGLGYNGVGGITAKGKIANWELRENPKKESFTINMSVMTPIGIYFLIFNIYSNVHSTAMLTGLGPGQITFDGDIAPISESRIFEGSSF